MTPKMGRPPKEPSRRRVKLSHTLDPEVVRWLRDQDVPASQLIEAALVEHYKLQRLIK